MNLKCVFFLPHTIKKSAQTAKENGRKYKQYFFVNNVRCSSEFVFVLLNISFSIESCQYFHSFQLKFYQSVEHLCSEISSKMRHSKIWWDQKIILKLMRTKQHLKFVNLQFSFISLKSENFEKKILQKHL
jgi:hypothetical protein